MMKFPLSSLLLVSLYALSSWSVSSGTFTVTHSPDVSVMEGETASIACCWAKNFERVTVNWLKNLTNIKSEAIGSNDKCQGSLPDAQDAKDQCKCSTLIFTKITREESGTYVCRVSVEIPIYTVVEGNATVLTVIARERTGDSTDAGHRMIITVPAEGSSKDDNTFETSSGAPPQEGSLLHIMRCLPILALIFTFFYLYNTGSKVQPQTTAGPGNNQTSVQTTEQHKDEEERAEREKEGEEEDEERKD
ncbi:uncharacterized protein [Channa argus]|uniref:uncharacterized protein isoform X1 n=2 Tax=Channa argus TaxID=215402 RepID=UPI0035226E3C